MDEGEFWVKVWKIVAATVVALVVTFAGCTSHQVSTIERMTAAGANPLDAKCAVGGTDGKECILRFAQSK